MAQFIIAASRAASCAAQFCELLISGILSFVSFKINFIFVMCYLQAIFGRTIELAIKIPSLLTLGNLSRETDYFQI